MHAIASGNVVGLYRTDKAWMLLLALLAFMGGARTGSTQIWNLDKGVYTISASFSSIVYDQAFNDKGDVEPLPLEVADHTMRLAGGYGVSDKLTLELSLPYKFLSTNGDPGLYNSVPGQYIEAGDLNGTGNLEAGAIYLLSDTKPKITASLYVEGKTARHNYITALQTGFNTWGIRPGVAAGWAFESTWLQFYLGSYLHPQPYSHAVISNLELGYKPIDYLYTAASVDLRRSFNNGGACDCNTAATALYLSDQEYIGLALKTGFSAGRLGLNIAYHTAFYGRNVAASGVPVVGIQYRSN